MPTTGYDPNFGILTERVSVPVGATVAYFLDVVPGQISTLIKYVSGGTLEVIGCTTNAALNNSVANSFGTTYSPAQLATLNGTGYLMGTTEILQIDGPTRCYLSSTGATTVVHLIKGRGQGF